MASKRKRYSREYKIKTVRLITGSDHTVSEVARNLEIHHNTLYKWIHQYGENPKEAFPGKGKQISEAEELSRLRRENQRLKMERDILKKGAVLDNLPMFALTNCFNIVNWSFVFGLLNRHSHSFK